MGEERSKQHGGGGCGGPGCVPGSEKMILCVDVRDRGCLQSMLVKEEVAPARQLVLTSCGEEGDCVSKRRCTRYIRTKKETRKKRDEIERKCGKTDARRQMMKMVARSGVHEVGTSGKPEGTQIVEGEGRTSNQDRIVQLPHIILRRTTL